MMAAALAATLSLAGQALAQSFTCTLPDQSTASRIVGGQDAAHSTFPWQVSIGIKDREAYEGHFCGGVLIGARWILTAAHCVVHDGQLLGPNFLGVRYGFTNLRSSSSLRAVEGVFPHRGYDGEGHDIALLKLAQPIPDAKRSYATLPRSDVAPRFVFPNACAVATGWGRTAPDQPTPSQLQAVALPIIDQETCRAAYKKHFGVDVIRESEICAGFPQGGKDACQGDSGGPLVVEGGPTGYVLAGVVSWGGYDGDKTFACAQEEGYGVYTRVSSYMGWIVKTIKANQ